MRCRIRAAFSLFRTHSPRLALAQEHALHFQSSIPGHLEPVNPLEKKEKKEKKTTISLFGALIKHSLWVYFVSAVLDNTNTFVKDYFEHLDPTGEVTKRNQKIHNRSGNM